MGDFEAKGSDCKYLKQTNSPSDGGEVRWYFSKMPLPQSKLAASVPGTEIVGKTDYIRFGLRDSLAIEASFLQREEELLSTWWKEYAECREGPRAQPSSAKKSQTQPDECSSEGSQSAQPYEMEEDRVGIPVKGGLYEVDIVKRHCFPVFWRGENRRVLRGHWFACKGGLYWLPIREDVAEQLEIAYCSQVWHRRTFQPSGLFAARVDLQGPTVGLHALFTGEDDTWEAWLNFDASGLSSVINLGGNGIKLRRGYLACISPKLAKDELRQQKEEEIDDYCAQVPIRHLVFMVHGIGQRLEKSNLVDDVSHFRHIIASLAERHLTSHQRDTQRILFIPCQWRKGLKLSGETAVEKITLDGVRALRVMLGATVHDVLYYMSPIYCQDIINSLSNQLNQLYSKFLKRNPGYDGKVSIYGHSLGSVLSYDILCHQENLSLISPMQWFNKVGGLDEPSISIDGQCATSNILTNMEDISSTRCNDPVDERIRNLSSSLLFHDKGLAEDFSAVLGCATCDLDRSAEAVVNSEQTDCKEATELVQDSNHVLPHVNGDTNEVTNMSYCLPISGLEKIAAQDIKDRAKKDKEIKFLKEEIDCLNAKIEELETQLSHEDTREKCKIPVTTSKQPAVCNLSCKLDDAPNSCSPYIKYTKLLFKVDTFFAVGSPLGVFLALRNLRIGIGRGREYWEDENIHEEMPSCCQMFNIFHPFDPVAYRVEPLVCKEYIAKRPVIIPYHKGGRRLHIGIQEFARDLAARSEVIKDHFDSIRIKVLTACQSRDADEATEGAEDVEGKAERSYGSLMMERLTGTEGGRIDHMLQDKTFEHPYVQAIGSHTNYWRDYDTALFILKRLYQDIREEPNIQKLE